MNVLISLHNIRRYVLPQIAQDSNNNRCNSLCELTFTCLHRILKNKQGGKNSSQPRIKEINRHG